MRAEQEALLADADDGLRAARLLLDGGYPGFAASRAYYAMFAAAQALLLSRELTFSRHAAVIAALGEHFVKPGLLPSRLHRQLISVQQDRLAADYGGGQRVTPADAERDLAAARVFVAEIQRFLSS